ncbi:hypothetical protein HanRHA438_Chr09g0387551 [Helianthus annuus]|nr:hypothetical protein HanRHA438_Chr09g0387551 [Helianthus annuus]
MLFAYHPPLLVKSLSSNLEHEYLVAAQEVFLMGIQFYIEACACRVLVDCSELFQHMTPTSAPTLG